MTPTSYHLNLNSNCQSTVFIFIATAAISRVMSVLYHSTNDHLSRTERCRQPQATYLKTDRASLSFPIWSCFGWGLHGYGCYQPHGSLLHCLSTLTGTRQTPVLAVYFCCTSLGVTSTGRYPASCPAKPGLSSPYWKTPVSRDHLLQLRYYYIMPCLFFQAFILNLSNLLL